MWELDYKESWVPKIWCFWIVVLEKTLESPLDCKEIQLVHPKGNQSWIFIVRTDAEAEIPKLWPPDGKNWLIGKDPDAGTDWRQEEKGTIEDKMVGWHHWLNGHEFEQTQGGGEGQGSLVCCHPSGHRVRHDWVTEPQQPVTHRNWMCTVLSLYICDIYYTAIENWYIKDPYHFHLVCFFLIHSLWVPFQGIWSSFPPWCRL